MRAEDAAAVEPRRSAVDRSTGATAAVAVVAVVVAAAAAARPLLERLFDEPAFAHWATIFVAIAVQAMPFLVLGVSVSAAIAALVPAGLLPRLLPERPEL